jgi:hypothetical protein
MLQTRPWLRRLAPVIHLWENPRRTSLQVKSGCLDAHEPPQGVGRPEKPHKATIPAGVHELRAKRVVAMIAEHENQRHVLLRPPLPS